MTEAKFPTTILAVSDGSEPARRAIAMAGEIARATGSRLHVVGVTLVSRYIHPDVLSEAQVERLKDETRERVEGDLAEARSAGVEPEEVHYRMGRIDAEVLSLAEELDVGLVVVGNRTADAVRRILLGDNAESIVRHAHCPVLVVRQDHEPPQ